MNHLKDIITLADECCRGMGIGPQELTHIAASAGPGSFTGIRIGVTTARTMAQALKLPCIAVPTLETLAVQALPEALRDGAEAVCTIINARRHQTYAALWDASSLREMEPQRQYMIEELTDLVQKRGCRTLWTGDGVDAYETILTGHPGAEIFRYASKNVRYQSAESAARIALRKALAGDTVSYEELLPEYMRRSEAEMRLEAGTLSRKIRG